LTGLCPVSYIQRPQETTQLSNCTHKPQRHLLIDPEEPVLFCCPSYRSIAQASSSSRMSHVGQA